MDTDDDDNDIQQHEHDEDQEENNETPCKKKRIPNQRKRTQHKSESKSSPEKAPPKKRKSVPLLPVYPKRRCGNHQPRILLPTPLHASFFGTESPRQTATISGTYLTAQ